MAAGVCITSGFRGNNSLKVRNPKPETPALYSRLNETQTKVFPASAVMADLSSSWQQLHFTRPTRLKTQGVIRFRV